jgi:hypothetical protein
MSIDETALHQLLSSAHWRGIWETILDTINSGELITIEMIDGTEIPLTESGEARALFLERFGWTEETP